MDIANKDVVASLQVPTAAGMWTNALKTALLPGLALMLLVAAPLAGYQIPGTVQGVSVHTIATLAMAALLIALAPMLWRSGYRHANSAEDRVDAETLIESNKQLHLTRYQLQKRGKELDEAIAQLKTQRQDMARISVTARRSMALAGVTINASSDAIAVTDIHGVVRGISPSATQLCGIHRDDAIGTPFDEVIQLFDPGAARPEQHPIKRIALRAIDAADAAPHLETCLLRDRIGKSRTVLVTSMAITDKEGTVVGAYIKLERDNQDGTATVRIPSQLEPITGLPARDTFTRQLDDLLRAARTSDSEHHLLLLTPDNLDFISDRHGYQAAEQVLWQIADICRSSTGDQAQCFAISAGRFAVLLPESAEGDARTCADNLRQELQQATLTWRDEHLELNATIALLPINADSPSVNGVMEMAESMLRAGRRAGGNRVHTSIPVQSGVSESRFDDRGWAEWLQQRLAAGLGHLMSQEILPADASKDQRNVECYMRIEDVDGVWVSPRTFLPALGRIGETAMMDIWVLNQVLQQLADNPDFANEYGTFAINIAAASLQDTTYSLRVSECLNRHAAHASQICFEITENTATSTLREVATFVDTVQKAGAKVAIDQARGVGFQQILQRCRPDTVKIDATLICSAIHDDLAQAQVRWIAQSAHLRDVNCTACGVEDSAWFDQIKALGVDHLQGSGLNKMGPLMV